MINKNYKIVVVSLAVQVCLLLALTATQAQKRVATGTVPPGEFKDPERRQKLAAAFPEVEKLFNASAERMPGAVTAMAILKLHDEGKLSLDDPGDWHRVGVTA